MLFIGLLHQPYNQAGPVKRADNAKTAAKLQYRHSRQLVLVVQNGAAQAKPVSCEGRPPTASRQAHVETFEFDTRLIYL